MSRPRRLASQKVVEKQKLDLSDFSEISDDGDFSSESSDDYRPNQLQNKNDTAEEESSAESSEEEAEEEEDTVVEDKNR